MAPALESGDVVLLRRRNPRTGDIVIVHHPRLGHIAKRLDEQGWLVGDNAESTPRERLGQLKDAELLGTAVLAIGPAGIRRLRARPPYSPRV